MYGLQKWKGRSSGEIYASVIWRPLLPLVKGDHAGQVEGRKKCMRPSDKRGISEFDGQSALTYWKGDFWLYARSNPVKEGHRSVQVCHGQLETFGAFELCTFENGKVTIAKRLHVWPRWKPLVSAGFAAVGSAYM